MYNPAALSDVADMTLWFFNVALSTVHPSQEMTREADLSDYNVTYTEGRAKL